MPLWSAPSAGQRWDPPDPIRGRRTKSRPGRPPSDDLEAALIANANAGGDNCHRGAVLGAILGAALGFPAIPERWIRGLQAHAELKEEIDTFIARFA
ncbi:MAG: ADP-ribosylglycohydrolase family protein [Candidatus Contendobacter sp.]